MKPPGRTSRGWSRATTACGAAAGAWAFTPRASGARKPWRRTDPRRSVESGKGGLTPPSCSTARPAWAGASSGRPMSCHASSTGAPTSKVSAPYRIGGSRASSSTSPTRHKGAAAAALKGALSEIARLGGGTVESSPEAIEGRSVSASFLHNGTVSMFESHGFERTRRLGKHHWVVARTVRRFA